MKTISTILFLTLSSALFAQGPNGAPIQQFNVNNVQLSNLSNQSNINVSNVSNTIQLSNNRGGRNVSYNYGNRANPSNNLSVDRGSGNRNNRQRNNKVQIQEIQQVQQVPQIQELNDNNVGNEQIVLQEKELNVNIDVPNVTLNVNVPKLNLNLPAKPKVEKEKKTYKKMDDFRIKTSSGSSASSQEYKRKKQTKANKFKKSVKCWWNKHFAGSTKFKAICTCFEF